MPELPEVETIRCDLAPLVAGRFISGFELFWGRTLRGTSPDEFLSLVVNRKIEALERRGKYLIFRLDSGPGFTVHFKMTGALLAIPPESVLPVHARALFYLDDGSRLCFTDPRKFGRIEPAGPGHSTLSKLGPEPLEPVFTVEVLQTVLARRKTPVKAVLLDQHLIAGIGNMYADEALYASGIHPLKPAQNLTAREITDLHAAIRAVLVLAIECKGATVSNYTRPDGQSGRAQEKFRVAHQRGRLCSRCNTPVERIIVRQRGTCICPVCQPFPGV